MGKNFLLSFILLMTIVGSVFAADPIPGVVVTCPSKTLYYKLSDAPRLKYITKEGVQYAALYLKDATDPVVTVAMQDGNTMEIEFDEYIDPVYVAALDLINAIGTVEYTDSCKAKIDAARAAYNSLTTDQQQLITAAEYKVLTDAEEAYAKLVTDHNAADSVVAKINIIGEVTYTDSCKTKIDAARAAYDSLTTDQQKLITAAGYCGSSRNNFFFSGQSGCYWSSLRFSDDKDSAVRLLFSSTYFDSAVKGPRSAAYSLRLVKLVTE